MRPRVQNRRSWRLKSCRCSCVHLHFAKKDYQGHLYAELQPPLKMGSASIPNAFSLASQVETFSFPLHEPKRNTRLGCNCPSISFVNNPLKIAYFSAGWTTWQQRVVAGVLQYAETHGPILVRYFAPPRENFAASVAELEEWGADGILCFLDNGELDELLAALKRPVPIICNAAIKERPGVFRLNFDFKDFAETAIYHFRHLGLRSLAFTVADNQPHSSVLVNKFLQIAGLSTSPSSTLIFDGDIKKFSNPFITVKPVPAAVADWLRSLPKPSGILCPSVGGGGYLIRCCNALGLRVPEDIAIIGIDDIDMNLSCEPTLTGVEPPREKLGFESMRLLQDWIAGKPPPGLSAAFPHRMELKIRGSTGLRKPEICDIAGALKYINENACRGITVAQVIAETQSVSKPTFHRRFQETVGKSPAEAIRDRKLDEVRRLLISTELPLTMVSDLSGFTSAMVLSQIFRAAEGVTMSYYRMTNKINPPVDDKSKRRPMVQT